MKYLLLAGCGLIGVFARYGVNSLASNALGCYQTAATGAINILGSFLIGLFYVAGRERLLLSEDLQLALMSGLLDGFTTFSAFSLDTVVLFTNGRQVLAGLYLLGTVDGGLSGVIGGLYVGRHIFRAV